MSHLDTLDDHIAVAIDRSEHLMGFVREDESADWRLLLADDSWIDVSVGDDALLSISSEVGSIGPSEGSHRLNQLMLQYLGFHPSTSFSIDAHGVRRLQRTLPAEVLQEEGLKDHLEDFASRARAWRDLLSSPTHEPALGSSVAHTTDSRFTLMRA